MGKNKEMAAWAVRVSHQKTQTVKRAGQADFEHTFRTNSELTVIAATVQRAADLVEAKYVGQDPRIWSVQHRGADHTRVIIDTASHAEAACEHKELSHATSADMETVCAECGAVIKNHKPE